tara:strand:+ start:76 stop:513 length:438 start_codon:yes stop_codon:yes gene_type:complete
MKIETLLNLFKGILTIQLNNTNMTDADMVNWQEEDFEELDKTRLAILRKERLDLQQNVMDVESNTWFSKENIVYEDYTVDEIREIRRDTLMCIAKSKENIPKMYESLSRNRKVVDVISRLKRRLFSSSSEDSELINHIEALLKNE